MMLHKSLFLSQVSLEPQLHSIQMTKILLLKLSHKPMKFDNSNTEIIVCSYPHFTVTGAPSESVFLD